MSHPEDGDTIPDSFPDAYFESDQEREVKDTKTKSEQPGLAVESSQPFRHPQPSSPDPAFSSQLPYESRRIRDAHKATDKRLTSNLDRSSAEPASQNNIHEGAMDAHTTKPVKTKKRRSKKHHTAEDVDAGSHGAGSANGDSGNHGDMESQAPSAIADDIRPFEPQASMDLDAAPSAPASTSFPVANGSVIASDAGEVDGVDAEEARRQRRRERKERKRAKKLAEKLNADLQDENPSPGSHESYVVPIITSSADPANSYSHAESEEPGSVATAESTHKKRRRRSQLANDAERDHVPEAEQELDHSRQDGGELAEERNQLPTPDNEAEPDIHPGGSTQSQPEDLGRAESSDISAQIAPLKRKAQDSDKESRKKRKQRLSQNNATEADGDININGDKAPAKAISPSPSKQIPNDSDGGSARRIGDLARDFYSQHYASKKSSSNQKSANAAINIKRLRRTMGGSPTAARLKRSQERSASQSSSELPIKAERILPDEEADNMDVDNAANADVPQSQSDNSPDLEMTDAAEYSKGKPDSSRDTDVRGHGDLTEVGSDDLGVDPAEEESGNQDAAEEPSTTKKSKQQRKSGSSKKRVAKTSFLKQAEDENAQDSAEPSSPTAATPSRKDKGKGKARAQPPIASAGPSTATPNNRLKQRKISSMMNGDDSRPSTPSTVSGRQVRKVKDPKAGEELTGQFSQFELRNMDHAIKRWREDHDLTRTELNDMVQKNPQVAKTGDFWDHVQAAMPRRKRQKIINQARKVYHNFVARGAWTIEQHDELALAYETHGKNYKLLGQIINRHPEDVRDRIRNYVVCGDKRRTDVWSHDEEARLVFIINEALDKIRQWKINEGTQDEPSKDEDMIDWQLVSENMNRTRSRIQCQTKWRQLRGRMEGGNIDGKTGRSMDEIIKDAREQFEGMPEKDRSLVAKAVRKSGARADSRIPWWKLRNDYAAIEKWERPTLILAWSRMRAAIPDQLTMSVTEVAEKLLTAYNETKTVPALAGEEINLAAEYRAMEQRIQKIIRGAANGPPKTPHLAVKSDEDDSGEELEQGNDSASVDLGDDEEAAASDGDLEVNGSVAAAAPDDDDEREINESEYGSPAAEFGDPDDEAPTSAQRRKRRTTKDIRETIEESPEAGAHDTSVSARAARSAKKVGSKSSNTKTPTSTTKRGKAKAKAPKRLEPDEDEDQASSDTDADDVEDIPAVARA